MQVVARCGMTYAFTQGTKCRMLWIRLEYKITPLSKVISVYLWHIESMINRRRILRVSYVLSFYKSKREICYPRGVKSVRSLFQKLLVYPYNRSYGYALLTRWKAREGTCTPSDKIHTHVTGISWTPFLPTECMIWVHWQFHDVRSISLTNFYTFWYWIQACY